MARSRIFGRKKITRIPIPEGWEKHGTGRRLFCFPQLTSDLAAEPEKVDTWVTGSSNSTVALWS